MSIVDGKGLVTWEGGLFAPDSALLPRVRWAFAQIRAAGGTISLNEAGRPFGVSSDQYARNSQDTESGLSTVWFQWGRYKRGETPSAANPAGGAFASEHTQGIAIDCNAAQPGLRAKYFALVGLENTISSETWHWAIRGSSTVDLAAYALAGDNITPFPNEEDDMPLNDDDKKWIKQAIIDVMWAGDPDRKSVVSQIGESIDATRSSLRGYIADVFWGNPDGRDGVLHTIGQAIDNARDFIAGKK